VQRRRAFWGQIALLQIAALLWAPNAWAFKQGYHEQITEAILLGRGFDADSADEAGDSNYWTDVFESTSDAAHGDNNQLGAASARMRQKRTEIGDALNRCERRSALDRLGEALHTVQDVYSHSNSIDNGFPIPDPLSLANGTANCALPNFAPGGLISGYFSVGGFMTFNQCRGIPANMCCHRDLNKDAPGENNGARHTPALNAARGGTQTYLDGLEQDIRTRFGEPKATQLINLLKKKQRTTYFVIDDTGSMSTDIAGVKAAVNSLLDSIIASGESPTLGLVSFKDSPSDRGITCDFEALRAQVNGLFASGGGDCPEASNSGLLTALSHFPEAASDIQLAGGRVLLATDASAGDSFLGPQVAAEAGRKGVSIDAILTGDCVAEESFAAGAEPFNPSDNFEGTFAAPGLEAEAALAGDPLTSISARTQLRALTEQTGGVLFNISRAEVDDVVPTLLELGEPATALLTSRKVDLASGTPFVLNVALDDTLDRKVTFMVTASRAGILPAVTLRRPGGATVAPADADATFRTLSSVKTITMNVPAVGRWQIQLDGQGTFVVRAFGASDLRLDSVRLQARTTSPSRPEIDLIPLEGQPAVGDTLVADFRFTEGPQNVAIALRQPDGDLLATLGPITPIDSLDPTLPTRRFRADLPVPGETFIVETTGTTPAGSEFVRQVTVPAQPQTVALAATPESAIASPGTSAPFVTTVRNVGTTDATYRVRATGSLPWTVSGGGTVAVPAGGAVEVGFTVFVPAGTPEGQVDQLTFFAEDVFAPRVRNSASASVISGSANRAPDCSAAAADPSALWPPNHDLAPIALSGLTDPDGDVVTFSVSGITTDEAVDANGGGDTAPDADGVGTSTPRIRAERSGNGDGRVYEIRFDATDGKGGSCSGAVRVGVPHNSGEVAVDSGQSFDATAKP